MADVIEKQRELIEGLYAVLLKSYGAREDELKKQELVTKIADLDGSTPYGLYAQGVLASYKNDLDEMIRKAEEAIKLQPDFALAHNELGIAYFSKDDMQAAEKEIREAIKQNPQSPIFHTNLGWVLSHQDRFIEAKAAYERAIELNPGYALAYYYLGLLFYWDLNLRDEAEKKFRAAASFAPKFAQAHTFLGFVLLQKEDFDEAGDELEEALELDPDFLWTHVGLGYLYAKKGDDLEDKFFYDDALRYVNEFIEKTVHDKESKRDMGFIYWLRGYVHAKLGRYERARADFIRAKNSDPKDLQIRRNLRRVNETLKEKRVSLIVRVFTVLLGISSFAAFAISFWLFFYKEVLHETQFVAMATGFFVLTIVCLYLPHVTRLKIGALELEKVSIKSLAVPPKLEI